MCPKIQEEFLGHLNFRKLRRNSNMEKTTVQVSFETLRRLKELKQHERESYDFLLNKLIDEAEEDELSEEEIEDIKLALEEVKKGKVYPIEVVAKELGIKLK